MIVKTLLGSVVFLGLILIGLVIFNFMGYGIRLIVEKRDHLSPSIKELGPNCIFGFFGSMIIFLVMLASYGIGINLF